MQIEFYPTDVQYTVKDGRPVVQLFGRRVDGTQICVIDETFEPYFYATGTPSADDLLAIRDGEYTITRVERVRKRLLEEDVDAYQIFVNIPKGVPIIKDLVKKLDAITGVFEYDILFPRRYLLDNSIIPMIRTTVEAEEVAWNLRVPCYRLTSITQQPDADAISPRILAVDIETYNPDNQINTKKHPIIMLAVYGKDFTRVVTWKRFATDQNYIEFVSSEADMLQRFVELVLDYQPDIITGYFSDGFDFPYLYDRAKINNVNLDLGLDYSNLEIFGKTRKEARMRGLCHVDIFKFIRKVMRTTLKTDRLGLNHVAAELLGEEKHDVDMDTLAPAWDAGSDELDTFAQYNLQDTKLTYELVAKMLPSLVEFVRIVGLPPYDITRMTFSTYVEWYLIRKAQEWNEIIPNRPNKREELSRIGDRVKGAFVFEPTPGFYKDLVVFDYRSLYPSIIASHNISKGILNKGKSDVNIETERGTFWYDADQKGFFSTIIEELIMRRADIKKQMKQTKDPWLVARSNALKVLANSFYGYMGFAPARWYCIECAESTTAWARHYIHQAIDTATDAGFRVLYSDTDSIFLLLEQRSVDDAKKLVKGINAKLPGLMELEFEGNYPAGIFVSVRAGEGGAKKKYALIDDEGHMTIKGFETVRRNWSYIAKEVQHEVLRIILEEHDAEKAKRYVRDVIEKLRANELPVEKVVIHTAISKGTESYASVGPHVAAAKRMEARGERVGAGTLIDYVVVKGEGKIRDKAKLPDEIDRSEYDGEYYVQNQIIPGVERIFAVLGMNVDEFSEKSTQTSLSGF